MTKHHAEKLFSFAQWAADHPSDQIPGDRLDIQLENHRAAIKALDDAVQRLVRADGKLNHDLLTVESFPKTLVQDVKIEARRELAGFTEPSIQALKTRQTDIEAFQLDLKATLDEIRHRQASIDRLTLQMQELALDIDSRVRQTVNLVTRATNAQAQAFEDANWNEFQANTAQDWALVSTTWAEYMDGNAIIPPNILAMNAITGDHWSSRWWANRAAGAFGMMAWWYQGAWPGPPPTTPNTPTGQPIPPGGMYFDTISGKMYVWTGSTWVPVAQGPAAATTSSLYYNAASSQSVFPLATADRFGNTFGFNQSSPEGVQASVNGVRLVPTLDYTVDVPGSTITFLRGLPVNASVAFDLLANATQLAPSGSAVTVLLSPIAPDGVKVTFTGLTVAAGGAAVNVVRNEELSVSVDGVVQQPGTSYNASGSQITFSQAPDANSVVFIVWFGPAGAGSAGGVVIPGPVDVKAQTVTQSGGALSVNRTQGENVQVSLTANITSISVSNWPSSGITGKVRIIFTNGGAFTVAGWPAGTIWPGGAAPVITSGSGKRDIVLLMSDNAGATVYGSIVGQDYR